MFDLAKKTKWLSTCLLDIKTGSEIAFRYCVNGEVRVFVHRKWKKQQSKIKNDPRARTITSDRDIVGSISDKWPDILSDLKALTGDVLLVSTDENRDKEGWEGEDAGRCGEDVFKDLTTGEEEIKCVDGF